MHKDTIREVLEQVAAGLLEPDDALVRMARLPFEDIGFAKIDHHRSLRCGSPEVIYCQSKTPDQVAEIADRIVHSGSDLLATRASDEDYAAVSALHPDAEWHPMGRCITLRQRALEPQGLVAVVTAGTSDMPVAEEAAITASMMGANVHVTNDVGVAGLHRLLACSEDLQRANALVVVAGMEGALASVVGGLVAGPVIAVPTSVGYGASFGGIAPLLSMLNSCAAGVAVVNIDNGFGGGYMAAVINAQSAGARRHG